MTITILKDKDEVINSLMELIKKIADQSIETNNIFRIAVSGGSLACYLAAGIPKLDTDLSRWKIFFCDERVVPEDSNDSTFGFYKSNLIGTTSLKEEQFVKLTPGLSAEEAAIDYTKQLEKYFPGHLFPRFDLTLLGMGPDGHTCSLFPGHELLEEDKKWVVAITDSPKPPSERITLTLGAVNNSRNCVFAMAGNEKADMVKRVLVDKEDLPAGRVNPTRGELYWILDEGAGKYCRKN